MTSLLDLALDALPPKPFWAEGETVELWKKQDGSERACLKRSGSYISIYVAYQGDEMIDCHAVGIIEGEGQPARRYLLNGDRQYRAWANRTQKYLERRRQLGQRRKRDEWKVKNAMWVTGPAT